MSQSGIISVAASGGGGVTANLSPYIVGSTKSDFTTISAAITAAIAAGASSSNQINIYIKPKPGVATYSENLTITDGINLIGMCPYIDEFFEQSSVANASVQVTGTITCSGEVSIANIQFNSTRITIADGIITTLIKLIGCNFSVSNNQTFITNNASLGATMIMDNCYATYGGGTGKFLAAANTLRLYTYDSQFSGSANTSAIASASTFQFDRTSFSVLALTFSIGGPATFNAYDCIFETLSIIDSNSAVIRFYNCPKMSSISITGGSSQVILQNCVTLGIPTITSIPPNYINCFDLTNSNSYYKNSTGSNFTGSEVHSFTANTQTSDATVTTLSSVTLNASETITLQGTITAAKSDHTDACGGNFNITVRRGAAGAPATIGTAVVNVNSSTTATFTVDNDGTSLVRIRVTGIAATTYNWVTNYTYQKVLTSS